MTDRVQRFGGSHTERKLDVVAKYLSSYVTLMKKQSWVELYYIDGFAGSGASSAAPEDGADVDPTLFDTESITEGSPVRALNVDPPFDRYEFVDADAKNVASLEALKDRYPTRQIRIHHKDANVAIGELCSEIAARRTARAVVFLDPFGRSVRWDTVVKLAQTEKVDLWYLVPVHAISRQVSKKGEFLPSAEKTDAMYGSTEWRQRAVRKRDVSTDLFGGIDDRLEKIAQAKEYSEMFRDRLRTVFKGGVADAYLPLGRGRLHEYSLMFACANPSSSAYGKALSIASHILRTA
jgi:three-Cys-motif partner protein